MLTDLYNFFAGLWATIGAALRLHPDVLQRVAADPSGDRLIVTMAVLAGSSLLAGQSMILFVNRVQPGRFAFSLVFYGIVFALSLALWAASVWLCAVALFGAHQPLGTALRIVGVGSAPLVFGFLVALPYLGAPIEWALRSWSMLIILVLVQVTFRYTIWQALACVLLGWLLIQVFTRLLGRPLTALRDGIWRVVTGTTFDTNEQELAAATQALRRQLALRDNGDYGGGEEQRLRR
jgi:hypothetical protein